MSFYTDLQSTVRKLIADKGQLVTLRKKATTGAYDTTTSTIAMAAPALYSASAVVLDFPTKEIDGTTIIRGDRKVLMPASSAMPSPEVGDSLEIGGVEHALVSVKNLQPAGTTVLYTLAARAGG